MATAVRQGSAHLEGHNSLQEQPLFIITGVRGYQLHLLSGDESNYINSSHMLFCIKCFTKSSRYFYRSLDLSSARTWEVEGARPSKEEQK